jgi:hypothetical protein
MEKAGGTAVSSSRRIVCPRYRPHWQPLHAQDSFSCGCIVFIFCSGDGAADCRNQCGPAALKSIGVIGGRTYEQRRAAQSCRKLGSRSQARTRTAYRANPRKSESHRAFAPHPIPLGSSVGTRGTAKLKTSADRFLSACHGKWRRSSASAAACLGIRQRMAAALRYAAGCIHDLAGDHFDLTLAEQWE